MSAKEVRFVGLVGLGAVAVFLVAFLVDPTPPAAGASSNDVLRHLATSSGSDRTAAFLFALSGAGLLVLTVLCVSVIGDALRDAIDPSSGSSRL